MKDTITIYVTDLNGAEHIIHAPTDMNLNLMEAMRVNGLSVKATCGGMALCATCNVVIESRDYPLPEMSEEEEAMLDEAFVLDIEGSRLSCQIPIKPELDGLRVKMGELTAD